MAAQRVQRRRTKGSRLPERAICVSRPSVWGNPWTTVDAAFTGAPVPNRRAWAATRFRDEWSTILLRTDNSIRARLGYDADVPLLTIIRAELGGRTLACWCPPEAPCHADCLLVLANPRLARPGWLQGWDTTAGVAA